MSDLKKSGQSIADLAREVQEYESSKQQAEFLIGDLKSKLSNNEISHEVFDIELKKITDGKSEADFLKSYDDYIVYLKSQIKSETKSAKDVLGSSSDVKEKENLAASKIVSSQEHAEKKIKAPPKKHKFSNPLDKDAFNRFVRSRHSSANKAVALADYVLYKPSEYGEVANKFFGRFSLKLTRQYPKQFKKMFDDMKASDFQFLSKTWISIMIFTSLIVFVVSFLIAPIFLFDGILLKIVNSLLLAVFVSILTFVVLYYYPSYLIGRKRSAMKGDYPFVVTHMSAVAGSGAKPISMFNLVLSAQEYKGLEPEIKKILNYVNLFGYDLTTALRLVAANTPLRSFNELLSGMVTTIETGGDMKAFLDVKAKEAMESYNLERKAFTETIATFSDIYIGISLAAPMMLFVLLSIINTPILGGTIAGLSAGTIATLGTFVALPILNLGFIFLVDILQPK